MEKQTRQQVAEALEGKSFNCGVDLGCGYGEIADILKKHCSYVVGVDKDTFRAIQSGMNKFYDALIQQDARTWEFSSCTQAVFMFDFIEHISLEDGIKLLDKIGSRYCIITTPSKFEQGALDGHVCLWSEEMLQQFGFTSKTYSAGYIRDRIYGKKIIAVREGDRL